MGKSQARLIASPQSQHERENISPNIPKIPRLCFNGRIKYSAITKMKTKQKLAETCQQILNFNGVRLNIQIRIKISEEKCTLLVLKQLVSNNN